ncbi:hypothetical protein SSX86_024484 [Deinandra increscens subsp. villosa]|uniref:Small auxin up regulated protein n=1 Tax=Deinandra increscens subsp. villosa TaxID=3103831 RepID=A0AAP0GQN1_9ASTR
MKKINVILRKCKKLSKQLSSSSLGSNSARLHHSGAGAGAGAGGGGGIIWNTNAISVYGTAAAAGNDGEPQETVFVGSTRKRYVISSKYLSHPLVNALLEKSKSKSKSKAKSDDYDDDDEVSVINCEVVLFDHLLWMLENADFNAGSDCLDELADLYSS